MTRLQAAAIVCALWALIYLPGLGSTEIKGEEGRRILPAITMLDGGSWLVPQVGGKAFLRKPPLVNWAIALSMKTLGRRDEWAARLPSALCVLALCGLMLAVSGPRARTLWTTDIAFIAAAMVLTQFGLLAKARFAGAEIEGIYVPLAGAAMVLWLVWWEQRRSPWLLWCGPAVFLGLAALAKAPLHLLFFYAIVLGVLWRAKEWRALRHPAHFVGLAIIVAIFAAWAVPYLRTPAGSEALHVWRDQFVGRVAENKFDVRGYLLNLPRGLADQLPWLLFAPVLWARRKSWSGREGALIQGTLPAIAACFVGLLLIPGVLTRYVLPLGVPLAMLLALAVGEEKQQPPARALRMWWRTNSALGLVLLVLGVCAPVVVALGERRHAFSSGAPIDSEATLLWWPLVAAGLTVAVGFVIFSRRRSFARPTRLAGATAALFGGGALLYATAAMPFIRRSDDLRPLARAIDAAVPPGQQLYLFDPEYQPAIFYLRSSFAYAASLSELPAEASYVLARAGNVEKLRRERPALQVARDFGGSDKNRLLLLVRAP